MARGASAWKRAFGSHGLWVYGDPQEEVIQLNENTIWAGHPNRNDKPDAKKYLSKVQELLFEALYPQVVNLPFLKSIL